MSDYYEIPLVDLRLLRILASDNYKKVFYIMGNHEAYETDYNLVRESIKQIEKKNQILYFLKKV